MLSILIYSKDRACQLDLLLRSIRGKVIGEYQIYVLYKYSTSVFKWGYNQIMELHPLVNYINQGSFKEVLIKTVKSLNTKYILPLCDDYVFINNVWGDIDSMFVFDEVKTVSLMLHDGVTYSFAQNMKLQRPSFLKMHPFLLWDWTKMPPKSYWGYPHQVCGNIYRTDYFYKLIRFKKFNGPNSLENVISWPVRKRKRSTPYMVAFNDQKVLAMAINCSQDEVKGNRLANNKYSLEYLNDKFLKGERIVNDFKQSNKVMDDVEIKFY